MNRAPALEGKLIKHRHTVKGEYLPCLWVLPLSRYIAATWELLNIGDDGCHPQATLFKRLYLLRSVKEQTGKQQEESYQQDDSRSHGMSISSLKISLAA